MRKTKQLYLLLGILAAVCIAAFAVSRHEEKKEQIRSSGEQILAIPADSVTALSWEYGDGALAFTRTETGWQYDGDGAFPVDEDRLEQLLEPFAALSAAFVIEAVEDYSQYGLEEPTCIIHITAGENDYTVRLGDFSKMDEQRYLSLEDGNAYLAVEDPLTAFDVELSDLIRNDTMPDWDTVSAIAFSGVESYTIRRREDGSSICAEDIYFVEDAPLDTDNVEDYLNALHTLSLSDYVSYSVTEEELENLGLAQPELTVQVDYTDANGAEDTVTVQLARDPEDQAAYEQAVADEADVYPSVARYVRLGDSPIVYQITETKFNTLTGAAYDSMRHQQLFTGDFDTVTAVEITLDGETVTFLREDGEEEETVWRYGEAQVDISQLKSELLSLRVSVFSSEKAEGQTEISLTLHLENEAYPTFCLTLYRYDGETCRAEVDGAAVGLASRAQTVDLMEAAREIILNADADNAD